MNTILQFFQNRPWVLYLIPVLFIFPALLINIGRMPLLADEPTRAIVALEMILSGNYIVPTINGEFYYNKPPLYNWILAGIFQLTGNADEWAVRIPTVASLILFGTLIYIFVKRYSGWKMALMTVFATITCGRILFYDSFLGLIDTLFSALIYLNFMIIWYFYERDKYTLLFVVSYLITAVAFMLKGLPALVFEGITLVVFFMMIKKPLYLISVRHCIAVLIFLLILTSYYSFYAQHNGLDKVFTTLWSESSKRTVAEYNIMASVLHIFLFPFETILHFLPWTVIPLLLLKKSNRQYIFSVPFLRYNALLLLANSIVYWLSPETRPRYLFMFLPLLFTTGFALYFRPDNISFRLVLEKIFLGMILVIGLAIPFVVLIPDLPYIPWLYSKLGFALAVLLLLGWLYYYTPDHRIILFCSVLLMARICFNWIVFPVRLTTEPQIQYRDDALEVARITKGQPLFKYRHTPLNHDMSFYITKSRNEILRSSFELPLENTFYITDNIDKKLKRSGIKIHYEFYTEWNHTKLYLIRTGQNELPD